MAHAGLRGCQRSGGVRLQLLAGEMTMLKAKQIKSAFQALGVPLCKSSFLGTANDQLGIAFAGRSFFRATQRHMGSLPSAHGAQGVVVSHIGPSHNPLVPMVGVGKYRHLHTVVQRALREIQFLKLLWSHCMHNALHRRHGRWIVGSVDVADVGKGRFRISISQGPVEDQLVSRQRCFQRLRGVNAQGLQLGATHVGPISEGPEMILAC
mmetsp:Transcript_12818/g.28246  ORF Transcript_12818/g.28246 Transcript_12818/m.28246 type:complete len:209 (+) Transcript_12818:64-690(+)